MQQLEQVLELDNSFEVAYSMVAELFVDNYTLELVGNCKEALLVEHTLLVVSQQQHPKGQDVLQFPLNMLLLQ